MKSYTKVLTTLSAIFAIVTFVASPVSADGCTNSYGANVDCPTTGIEVMKKVAVPGNPNLFVENLNVNDAAYAPGDTVEYDLAITNKSDVDFSDVTVTDTYPEYLTYKSGPGTYNEQTRVLTFTLSSIGLAPLKAKQTVHVRITGYVNDARSLPEVGKICEKNNEHKVTNRVKVVGPNNQTDEHSSTLCVQTNVLGTTTLPAAGFDDYAFVIPFALLALLSMGGLAYTRRRSI